MNFCYYIFIIKIVIMWASLTGSKGQLYSNIALKSFYFLHVIIMKEIRMR